MKAITPLLSTTKKAPGQLLLALEISAGIIISLFTSSLFLKITDSVLEQEHFNLDVKISTAIYQLRTPILTPLMNIFSLIGQDGIIVFSIIIPIIFYLKKRRHEAVLFTIMIAMGITINLFLKSIIQRPRPALYPLADEHSFSFPSGHSMNSFIFFTTVAYFFYHFTHKKKLSLLAFVISGAIILCIGASRVYLGVHYPSDVLGGYLAGFLWMVSFIVIDKTLVFYKLFKEHQYHEQK